MLSFWDIADDEGIPFEVQSILHKPATDEEIGKG